jgi:hypothetical protein
LYSIINIPWRINHHLRKMKIHSKHMKMSSKFRKSLLFLGLILTTALLLIVGMPRLAAQPRVPNAERLPSPFSATPPEQCMPSQKASWLLPVPEEGFWKRLQRDKVSFWVPSRYQVTNPPPDISALSDPTATSFQVIIPTVGVPFKTDEEVQRFIVSQNAVEKVVLSNYKAYRMVIEQNWEHPTFAKIVSLRVVH